MSYKRELKTCMALKYDDDMQPDTDNLQDWILQQIGKENAAWILGHDLDGLIWGRIEDGKMSLAHDIAVPSGPAVWEVDGQKRWGAPLRESTLLDLRVFSPDFELRIWRGEEKLKGCFVRETGPEAVLFHDEPQILIASKRLGPVAKHNGQVFSLLEGPAGQRQALPVDWNGEGQKYRLWVRHYTQKDETTGMLSFQESRLLALQEKNWKPLSDLGVEK